ncbi:hypothetical protein HUU39_01310 [candidate division KSB1 bacterium]|nr:hypothetical protein [bacterium]NUM63903.1 hypothetical protein [candidate division KSB1 bacterium]
MRKHLVVICLWAALALQGQALAQPGFPKSDYPSLSLTDLAQILRPNDAQGMALGLTGAAYREGLFATYTNPAGLRLDDLTVAYSHIPAAGSFSGMLFNQEAFALGLPVSESITLGAHFFNLNLGTIELTDRFGNAVGEERIGVREAQLSGAARLGFKQSMIALGLNTKYLEIYLPGLNAHSFLVDAGMRYRLDTEKARYALAVSVSNLGEELKHGMYSLGAPIRLLRSGLSAGTVPRPEANVGVMATLEYQRSLRDEERYSRWNHLGLGVELQFLNHLYSRLGYNFDFADVSERAKIDGFTYGLGFHTPRKIKVGVPIDLSLHYGKGLTDYRQLDTNVITIALGLEL